MPGAVDQRESLSAGIDHRAQVRPRAADRVGDPRLTHDAVDRDHAGCLRVGVDAEHIGSDLREKVGHDEARGAVGKIEHELHLVAGVTSQSERVDDGRGVELDGARREVDVADLARRHAAELLAVVHPLDPTLVALGEIDAAFVEEADDHRLRVVRAETHGQAAAIAADAEIVTGHGHRRQLEVVDVDPHRVASHHEGSLEHPGDPAGVTRGRDVRALLEARGPRLGEPHRQLRADVDVGDALHALGAEEGAGPARFPHD